MAPGLLAALKAGGLAVGARVLQAGLFAALLHRHPVPALWVFLLPNLVFPFGKRRWLKLLGCGPLLALLALGVAAWRRGMVSGLWLVPWELAAGGVALALLLVRAPTTRPHARSPRRAKPGRGR
jgi:hypothetical protein